MRGWIAALVMVAGVVNAAAQGDSGKHGPLVVIQEFERGLRERDLSRIEPLMAEDMVAFENGHRNDGWADFRDNHLVPEMKEPAPPMKTEMGRISVSSSIAWAYSKSILTLTGKSGQKVEAVLWTIYALEKRGEDWKIVMLDWSFYVPPEKPPAKPPPASD